MNCSRCSAEAVVKRGAAAYCAKCALARDWEEIIAIVQEDRVDVTPSTPLDVVKKAPDSVETAKTTRARVAADPNGGHLPADPFA